MDWIVAYARVFIRRGSLGARAVWAPNLTNITPRVGLHRVVPRLTVMKLVQSVQNCPRVPN